MAQSPPASTIHAEIGNVTNGSQVAVGNNILQIQQLHGDLVYVQTAKPAPPRLRTQPVSLRPRAFRGLLDRETETSITLIEVGARRSVECSGEAGTGKTSFLRHIAHHPGLEVFGAGVLYFQVNQQSTSDLLKSLFDAFYETDIPVKPTETEIRTHLRDLNALILLDEVDGEDKKIEFLMNVATECTFVSATPKRSLFGETQALTLRGLPNPDAVTLFERELGRPLSPTEKQVAERLCESLGCVPQRILLAAHQARERKEFLEAIALLPVTASADSLAAAEVESSSDDERKVLAALAVFAGAPVGVEHIEAIAGVHEAAKVLAALEQRGVVSSHNDRWVLASVIGNALDENLDPLRKKALAHFHSWTVNESRRPQEIVDAAEPALLMVKWGMQAGMYGESHGLAHAMQSSLALSGKWDMWADSLHAILTAGQATQDTRAQAWALHQLGTRALCLGALSEAKDLLQHALSIREAIGDVRGAEATRHNLNLIPPAPIDDDTSRQTSRSTRTAPAPPLPIARRSRFWPMVAGVGIVAAIVAAVILFWPDRNGRVSELEMGSVDSAMKVTDTARPTGTDTLKATNNVDSSTPPARPLPQIVGFKADPAAIQAGQQAQLCFGLKDAVAVQIAGAMARRSVTADRECIAVSPESSRSYTLTAFNADGAVATVRTSIKVVAPDPDETKTDPVPTPPTHARIVDFGVSSTNVTAGVSVRVCYQFADATRASLEPLQKTLAESIGCISHTPTESTTYTLTVVGEDQLPERRTLAVTVVQPPRHARILSFTSSSTNVVAGTAVRLCYRIADAQSFNLEPSNGPLPAESGCVEHTPKGSTRYVLSATGEDNQREQREIVVSVRRAEPPDTQGVTPPAEAIPVSILRFIPDSQTIAAGRTAQLCFTISGAGAARLVPSAGVFRTPVSRCVGVSPTTTTVYTLTAKSRDGREVSDSAIVKVTTPVILKKLQQRR